MDRHPLYRERQLRNPAFRHTAGFAGEAPIYLGAALHVDAFANGGPDGVRPFVKLRIPSPDGGEPVELGPAYPTRDELIAAAWEILRWYGVVAQGPPALP